jgi:hypothetical protein
VLLVALRRWRETLAAADPTLAAYVLFLVLMLAQHTILHPEDRFSLVFVPACALFAALLVEHRRTAPRALLGAAIVVILYVWQIVVWDSTTF